MVMNTASDQHGPYRGPVSVKGVVLHDGAVVLLKNEREEWELPGGQLERGETPEACVVREVEEELGLRVCVGPILDAWVYQEIVPGADVLILTYGCYPEPFTRLTHSAEHSAAGWFRAEELDAIPLPDGYKRAIRAWAAR